MTSKLKLTTLIFSMAAILFCAWANHLDIGLENLDTIAMKRVDEGFKRALISFGTARAIGAVISVAQGTDVTMQPLGFGLKLAPGQVLHPIGDLIGKFADLMLTATVIFGAMKVLLLIGGNYLSCMAVTGATMLWAWFYWRGYPAPLWLSRLVVVLMLLRFSVPVVMVGSDVVFQQFMANEYKTSQSALDATSGELKEIPKAQHGGIWKWLPTWVPTTADVEERVKTLRERTTNLVEHVIKIIVVFLLQTLVIPLLFFWALYRVFTAMFQNQLPVRTKISAETQ